MVADGDRDRPTVLSVQKYESGPPVVDSPDGQLVSSTHNLFVPTPLMTTFFVTTNLLLLRLLLFATT